MPQSVFRVRKSAPAARAATARRAAGALACLTLTAHLAAGCAGKTEETGAAIGAGVGAAVGAVTGAFADKKNPGRGAAIGAATGAVAGGVMGWVVGSYRVKQVRIRDEAVAATGYTPQQGVVARVDQVQAAPGQIKPGDQLTFQGQYTVLGPPEGLQIRVKESQTLYYNDQALTDLPPREMPLLQGTNQVQHTITIPADAAEGTYRVTTIVQPVGSGNAQRGQASTTFVVTKGAAAVAAPATRPAPAAPAPLAPGMLPQPGAAHAAPAPPQAPRPATPEVVYVKAGQANVREAAGTSHRIVATVGRGTRLTVVGQSGPDSDRWYKVRLDDGREAWVAASVVSFAP
jgi:hypothetical protein